MKNLVRIGVANPRKQVGVRQRTLDRVIAGQQPRAELLQVSFERLQAATIEFGQRLLGSDWPRTLEELEALKRR